MFYIIQENLFREANYQNIINGIQRLNLKYEIVKVRPFIEDIEFKTKETDIFVFGSIKLSRLGKKYNWLPGSLHNKNHDYEIYKKYYKENLLNFDSKICTFDSEIDFIQRKFIRPTLDTKTFTGRVFDSYEWEKFKDSAFKNGSTLTKDTKIQVSSVKPLFNESRFWIINGKISTYSSYKIGGMYTQSRELVSQHAINFCNSMINQFQLADAFVMDIAQTENGYKIVECGCINSAGFYDADLQKLIIDLENFYNE